jgi:hypothetical protein
MAITANEFIESKDRRWRAQNGRIRTKDRGRQGWCTWHRQAWTFMPQHNLAEKVFVVERLERGEPEGVLTHAEAKTGDVEYRIGYYIVGRIGRANDRWVWGQFCPLIPAADLEPLLAKARRDGTILPT